jgi:hypothetical protein
MAMDFTEVGVGGGAGAGSLAAETTVGLDRGQRGWLALRIAGSQWQSFARRRGPQGR